MTKYRKLSLIKAGGQADVYRGADELGSPVAIKQLRLSDDEAEAADQRRRFEREVKCHTTLDHPGIVKVLAANVKGEKPFFIMPYAEDTLRTLLEKSGAGLSADRAIEIMEHLLGAMAHAHSEGVIHRDLKPDNILIVDGDPKIADFGYGRRVGSDSSATMTRGGLGTEGYAAPEQFMDAHEADERTDVYALGCIFYEMLTGVRFAAGQGFDRVPPQYKYTIITATSSTSTNRFASVTDMAAQLELADGRSVSASEPGEVALELASRVGSGDTGAAIELLQLLIANDSDTRLYLNVLPYFESKIVDALATHDALFKEVVEYFDEYASGSHPFSFTDRIAIFLSNCFRATRDFELRLLILERLLELGYSHNRYFVGQRFVDLVASVERDPSYPNAIVALLRRRADAASFVRTWLLRKVSNRAILATVR